MSTWGKSNPEGPRVEIEEQHLELSPVSERHERRYSWRLIFSTVAVIVFIGTLWLKPWGETSSLFRPVRPTPAAIAAASVPAPTAAPATPAASIAGTDGPVTPAPTQDPLVLAAQRRQCQSPSDWRMVTAESTVTRDTRTMYAATPIHAAGPTDPVLPLSHLYADTLRAVGVCVPRTENANPTATLSDVVLWRVDENGVAHEIDAPPLLDVDLYNVGEAYFQPPADEGTTWPPGRYVFEIRPAGERPRWMALEFTTTRG